MSERNGAGRVVAVLGPTNTGKTHLAVERMLGHRSGMIGLPLRLLAREIYDRVVATRGAAAVALITGEERIVPAHLFPGTHSTVFMHRRTLARSLRAQCRLECRRFATWSASGGRGWGW